MNHTALFCTLLISANTIFGMYKTKTDVDKEVAAFSLRLEQIVSKTPKVELSPENKDALIALCTSYSEKKRKKRKRKRRRKKKKCTHKRIDQNVCLQQTQSIYESIKKYTQHTEYNNIPARYKEKINELINSYNTNFPIISAAKTLNEEHMQFLKQLIFISKTTLQHIKQKIRDIQLTKLHTQQKAHLELRKKSFGSKIEHYVRQCSCCKKKIIINTSLKT